MTEHGIINLTFEASKQCSTIHSIVQILLCEYEEKRWLLRLRIFNYFSSKTCDNHAGGEKHSTSPLAALLFFCALAHDFRCKLSLFQHIKVSKGVVINRSNSRYELPRRLCFKFIVYWRGNRRDTTIRKAGARKNKTSDQHGNGTLVISFGKNRL
jgi:hypothetical protein